MQLINKVSLRRSVCINREGDTNKFPLGEYFELMVKTKVETASTEYQFDRIMVLPNNLVNRIIYLFFTLERIVMFLSKVPL